MARCVSGHPVSSLSTSSRSGASVGEAVAVRIVGFVDNAQAGRIPCELKDAFDRPQIPELNHMDHPLFGTISEAPRGWSGAVQIGFFSEFDDVASAPLAEKSGGRDYRKTADQGYKRGRFELIVHGPEGKAPSSAQERAFVQFLENQELVCITAVKAIFDYYRREREMWFTGHAATDEILVPEVQSPDDLKRLIRLRTLNVLDLSKDGCSLIGFAFRCCWDTEHGLGVLVHGTRVVEVGENDITWNGPSRRDNCRQFS